MYFLVSGLLEGRKQGKKQQLGRIGRKEGGREERKEVRREGRKEGGKEEKKEGTALLFAAALENTGRNGALR